jgi:hypothetical protein
MVEQSQPHHLRKLQVMGIFAPSCALDRFGARAPRNYQGTSTRMPAEVPLVASRAAFINYGLYMYLQPFGSCHGVLIW